MRSVRLVKHPTNGVMVRRNLARDCIVMVSSDEQAVIDAERDRRGLAPEGELDEAIRRRMDETVGNVQNP